MLSSNNELNCYKTKKNQEIIINMLIIAHLLIRFRTLFCFKHKNMG